MCLAKTKGAAGDERGKKTRKEKDSCAGREKVKRLEIGEELEAGFARAQKREEVPQSAGDTRRTCRLYWKEKCGVNQREPVALHLDAESKGSKRNERKREKRSHSPVAQKSIAAAGQKKRLRKIFGWPEMRVLRHRQPSHGRAKGN